MPSDVQELKRKLKYGPKMGRELRAEFLSVQVNAPPRRLTPATVAKLKAELARLATSNDPRVRRFLASMAERYPGVCA
jgi:hypothetical protein